jgi:uracil-DNA glycosylase
LDWRARRPSSQLRPTVRAGKAGTHRDQGWETFTKAVVKLVCKERSGVVFCLWGDTAIRRAQHIDRRRHYVLPAAHPSARGKPRLPFSGCRHFSQVNALLRAQRKKTIRW